jgi:hypothetical protein
MRPPLGSLALVGMIIFIGYLLIEINLWRILTLLLPLLAPAFLIIFNAHVVAKSDPNLLNYNNTVRSIDLSIPPLVQIATFWPFVLGGLLLLFIPIKNGSKAIAVALLACSIAMINNDLLGYNNHPYRYMVYAFPAIVIAAAAGLKNLHALASAKGTLCRGVSYLVFAIVSIGVVKGIYMGISVSFPLQQTNSFKVNNDIKNLAALLENNNPKEGYVFVYPAVAAIPQLACYTSTKYYMASIVGFNENFDHDVDKTTSYAELINRIKSKGLPISLILIPSDWLDEHSLKTAIATSGQACLIPFNPSVVKTYDFITHIGESIRDNLLDPNISKNEAGIFTHAPPSSIFLHAPQAGWASVKYLNIPTQTDAYLTTGIYHAGPVGDGVICSILINGSEVARHDLDPNKTKNFCIPLANYNGAAIDVTFRVSKKETFDSDWAFFVSPRLTTHSFPENNQPTLNNTL